MTSAKISNFRFFAIFADISNFFENFFLKKIGIGEMKIFVKFSGEIHKTIIDIMLKYLDHSLKRKEKNWLCLHSSNLLQYKNAHFYLPSLRWSTVEIARLLNGVLKRGKIVRKGEAIKETSKRRINLETFDRRILKFTDRN